MFGRLGRIVALALLAMAGVRLSVTASDDFWAFQPIRRPAPPETGDSAWTQTDIDGFILASLSGKSLRPSPPASRRDLIRRLSFDLTGLPPAPEEITRFEGDTDPMAVQRLIDRYLASPQYGERWGRWWLDIARYADTNGQDENKVMANAWRYRDWVIRAFNANQPFDQFITYQLAGDLLPTPESESDSFDRLTATGFLVLGPKMLAEQDKPKLVMDIIDEQVDTIGRAFLGLTLGCARCHDHKFDPVPARDYYALAGIFRSTRTMENLAFVSKSNERRVATSAEVAAFEDHQKKLSAITNRIGSLRRMTNSAAAKDPRPELSEAQRLELADLERERTSLSALTPPPPSVTLAVSDDKPTDLPIHLRGNHLNPAKEPIPRGFLEVVNRHNPAPPIPAQSSGRLELARWLVAPENPLTARVIVNRVWQAHFGEGLVRTADNFGLRGEPPSHPELLDWLADRFIRSGWNLKDLHRVILHSAVYQQSSERTSDASEVESSAIFATFAKAQELDPDNRLLRAFPRRRLEAEMIRDALLFVSDRLDVSMGGSLVSWKNDDYAPGDDMSATSLRRSIYLPIVRDRVYDALTLFDFANPSVTTATRTPTVVAHQALFFLNSPLVKDAAKAIAASIAAAADRTGDGAAHEAYRRILGRAPSVNESRRAQTFFASFPDAQGQPVSVLGQTPIDPEALEALCQTLLASNEFIYRP